MRTVGMGRMMGARSGSLGTSARHVMMMQSVDPRTLHTFFDQYPIRQYKKSQVLILANDTPKSAFYLESGRIRVYDVTYRGEERIVYDIKAPALFPLPLLVGVRDTPYIYEAHTDLIVRQTPIDHVRSFILSQPTAAYALLVNACQVLESVLERTAHLLSSSAKTRLVYSLVVECRRYGERQGDGSYRVSISEQELGAQAGLSRETVSREAKRLKADQLIRVGHHEMIIPNLALLEQYLEQHS